MTLLLFQMEQQFKEFIERKNCEYIPLISPQSLEKIYNLYWGDILFNPSTVEEFYYVGLYYHICKPNINLMKENYLIAIDGGNSFAMNNLAFHYSTEKNYDLMEKYFLMSVDKGNPIAMDNLGYHYRQMSNKELMKKYFLMAISNNNRMSLVTLGYYYSNRGKLFKKMVLYIKNMHLIERHLVINSINDVSKLILTEKQQDKFLEIILDFEFQEDDKIYTSIRLLSNSLKIKITDCDMIVEKKTL